MNVSFCAAEAVSVLFTPPLCISLPAQNDFFQSPVSGLVWDFGFSGRQCGLLSQRVPERNLWWGSSASPFLVFTLWILMSRRRASRGEWRVAGPSAGISNLENRRRFGISISAFLWMDALQSSWRDALRASGVGGHRHAATEGSRRWSLVSRGFWKYFRFSAGAMLFGSWAELREQSRKPENFFGLDLKQISDLLNPESLAHHFESRHLLTE